MSKKQSFEKNMEIININIEKIKNNDLELDKSIKLYKQTMDLLVICEKQIKDAKLEVEVYEQNILNQEGNNE